MSIGIIKVCGNTFTLNSTPNTVPTYAGAGGTTNSQVNAASGSYSNGATGGARFLYIVNTGTGSSNVTVANNGLNNGPIIVLSNTAIYVEKYAFDLISSTNNSTMFATPIAFAS